MSIHDSTDVNIALQALFVIVNVGIVAGYMFIAFRVVPHAAANLRRTKIGGITFFITCGLTHAEMAFHVLKGDGMPLSMMISWHMMIVHVVQVFAVWAFVTGLYLETTRWGPWGAGHQPAGRLDDLADDTSNTGPRGPTAP